MEIIEYPFKEKIEGQHSSKKERSYKQPNVRSYTQPLLYLLFFDRRYVKRSTRQDRNLKFKFWTFGYLFNRYEMYTFMFKGWAKSIGFLLSRTKVFGMRTFLRKSENIILFF